MKLKYIIFAIILLMAAAELFLRHAMGFCDALLFRESDKYEYIAQPGQQRHRFGARICYNSFSQRSDEPDTTRVRILGLGDSVLFGGTWMDQDSLATTLFGKETGMQMLNIAAGSWGPDNCAAYLKEKGCFGAKAMVLVCSSHDAYDTMTFTPVVGRFPNYPDRQYRLAIWEVTDRYLMPRIKGFLGKMRAKADPDASVVEQIGNAAVKKKTDRFNPGFGQLKEIADSLDIPMGIYLHAETGEIEAGEYNTMGKEIMEWAEANGVYLIKGIDTGEDITMYKDVIHYNAKGQKHLARVMEDMTKCLQKRT